MAGWTLSLARFHPVAPPLLPLCFLLGLLLFPAGATGQAGPPESVRPAQNSPHLVTIGQPGEGPINLTADRVSFDQDTGVYDAQGSVVIVQGPLRLTADHVIYRTLTGVLIATGRVHLSDPGSDLWSERLEMNVNTEVGVVVNGELFLRDSTTTVTGRLLQRFSEDHYRGKDGSFTNCDTREGMTPAWRFRFEDLDMDLGDRLYAKNLWFCVNDVPIIP
ncbi:MAG: LptA/OstA family protein, partial [Nitrospirales bacterium]